MITARNRQMNDYTKISIEEQFVCFFFFHIFGILFFALLLALSNRLHRAISMNFNLTFLLFILTIHSLKSQITNIVRNVFLYNFYDGANIVTFNRSYEIKNWKIVFFELIAIVKRPQTVFGCLILLLSFYCMS